MSKPVKQFQQGIKVTRGEHWCYGDQDKNSIYGIMACVEDEEEGTEEDGSFLWIKVEWIDYKGEVVNYNNYRVSDMVQDLSYYEEK